MGILDCIKQYGCYQEGRGILVKLPPPGAIYTPYVRIIQNGEILLTTGNSSSPFDPHHAMITSFQYGAEAASGACGCTIEAIDESGTAYERIVKAINKDITKTRDENHLQLEFGWLINDCDGHEKQLTNLVGGQKSHKLFVLPLRMSTNFDGGLIKFVLECVDPLSSRSADNRLESNVGTEDGKVNLTVAHDEIFTKRDPKFKKVKRQSSEEEAMDYSYKANYGSKDGYYSVHNVDQETNLGCSRKWLNNIVTSNDRGIFIMYDPEDITVVHLEAPKEDEKNCCDSSRNGDRHLGTYIVNGGNSSPVISFNPSFDWILASNDGSGGTASGASSGDGGNKDIGEDGIQNTGVQTSPTIANNKYHWLTPNEHSKKTNESFKVHSDATKRYEIKSTIEAELKIIGNPSMVNPVHFTSKWVSIVVIDPHYIKKDASSGDTCIWLAESNCNRTLSNKQWFIKGVDHQITSGSYVTTLKVMLAAPGVDKSGMELGCEGMSLDSEITTKVEK